MDVKHKFRLKVFLLALILEPWTEDFRIPNFRTINFIFMGVSLYFRWKWFILGTFILMGILQLIDEYKKGDYIRWYRQRKNINYRQAIKESKRIDEGADKNV